MIVVGQGTHRFLILPDTRRGECFHRPDDRLQISGTVDLSVQALDRVAHGCR